MVSATFAPGNDGTLLPGTSVRVKPLENPIRLGCNQKLVIEATGYNSFEPLGNFDISNDYNWEFDGADGDLQFQNPYTTSVRNWDTYAFDFYPSTGYAAGMFVFEPLYGITGTCIERRKITISSSFANSCQNRKEKCHFHGRRCCTNFYCC